MGLRVFIYFAVVGVSFFSEVSLAQTACPVGTAAGAATCGPTGGDEIATQSRPTGEWIKTWGAIATSPSGDGGVSSGRLSKEQAESVALQNCKNSGVQSCKVEFVYKNQCVAAVYPVGADGGVFSTAATIEGAVSRAKSRCESLKKGECKVAISECSDPVFRKF